MSNQSFRPGGFNILPPVIKNLLIINGLFYLATMVLSKWNLIQVLGLHAIESPLFRPYQLVTHMFMHSNQTIWHILSNMFALWMFGNAIENIWGGKRFLIFYLLTGFGAAALHLGVMEYQIHDLMSAMNEESISTVMETGAGILQSGQNFVDANMNSLNLLVNMPTVGASGAVFGILIAFGMMFPNSVIYLYFAIPIKAKYFVILYGALELFQGVRNAPGDNVAHFAHLGGALFGFLLIKYWNRNRFHHN